MPAPWGAFSPGAKRTASSSGRHGSPQRRAAARSHGLSHGHGCTTCPGRGVRLNAGNSGARRDKKGCIGSLYRSWRGPTVHARADSGSLYYLDRSKVGHGPRARGFRNFQMSTVRHLANIRPLSLPAPRPFGIGTRILSGSCHSTTDPGETPTRGGGKRVGSAVHVHRKPDVRVASKGCLIARGYVGLGTPMGRNFPFSPHRIHKARKHTELDAHVGVRRYCVPIPSRLQPT